MLRSKRIGILIVAVSVIAVSGCGGLGGKKKEEAKVIPKGEIAKQLNFSNWPLYIDIDEKTKKRPTLEGFREQFGATVKYTEEINDNNEFFGKVRQQLEQGKSGGRDLFVVTDWMASKMIRLSYLQKLDASVLPNVEKNLLPAFRKPSFDPNRDFTVPWQTGMTGLIYRSDKVGDIKSIKEIFNPRYKGKVTMLSEMRDSVGLTMLAMGKNPDKDGLDAEMAAIDKIKQASDSGQIRRFTGNDYTKDLTKGDAWISFGWSGDAVQLQADNPNIRFLMPDEGFMLWSDNMVVPVGAPNPYTAEVFMNYVYEPKVQAPITAYVNYVSPVKDVKEILQKSDPSIANNPLVFPSEEDLKRGYFFKELNSEDERKLDQAFQKVISG